VKLPFLSRESDDEAELYAEAQALLDDCLEMDFVLDLYPDDAAWLAGVPGAGVPTSDAADSQVAIPGCILRFVSGPANRITEVVLDGPGAPAGEVARLRYRPMATGN